MSRDISIGLGRLRVGPRPRGGDWLATDLAYLKSEGFSFIVSLLTGGEEVELELAEESSICAHLGLDFYSFPIIDRATPSDRGAFEELAKLLLTRLLRGEVDFCTAEPVWEEHRYWLAPSSSPMGCRLNKPGPSLRTLGDSLYRTPKHKETGPERRPLP